MVAALADGLPRIEVVPLVSEPASLYGAYGASVRNSQGGSTVVPHTPVVDHIYFHIYFHIHIHIHIHIHDMYSYVVGVLTVPST